MAYVAYLHRNTVESRKQGRDYYMLGDEWTQTGQLFYERFVDEARRIFISCNRLAIDIDESKLTSLPETLGCLVRVNQSDLDLLRGPRRKQRSLIQPS